MTKIPDYLKVKYHASSNPFVRQLIEHIAALTEERDDLAQSLSDAYESLGDVNRSIHLHDHIFKLKMECDELKTQVERLSAPVSNEELEPLNEKFGYFKYKDAQGDISRDFSNSLIATRASASVPQVSSGCIHGEHCSVCAEALREMPDLSASNPLTILAIYDEIFAKIWGLAQTDCGPEDYESFPEMLRQSFNRLKGECDELKLLSEDLAIRLQLTLEQSYGAPGTHEALANYRKSYPIAARAAKEDDRG